MYSFGGPAVRIEIPESPLNAFQEAWACPTKVRYSSRIQAERMATPRMKVYSCGGCFGFHLTTKR